MNCPYTVFLESMERERIGVLDHWESLDVIKRYNEVGKIIVSLGHDAISRFQLLASPFRLSVWRNGNILSSGIISSLLCAPSMVSVICDDDIGLLRWRLGLPVPDGPPYTTADYDVREGVAESVMKELLLDNLKDNRSMDSFQISVDKGRGNAIQLKARFDLLLSLLQEAGSKGNLKFDVVDGLFDVSIPQNLQNEVVFSFGNGNLLDYQLKQKACLGNYGYLLGEGELKDRFVYEGGNSSSQQLWGRREFVRDERRLKASDDFSQALDSSLKEYDEVFELQATCIDSSVAKYGEDYFVGTKVKVFVPKLFAIEEQVSEVRFRFDAENGDVVQPTIGNVDPLVLNGGMTFFSQQRALAKRIGNLEKV